MVKCSECSSGNWQETSRDGGMLHYRCQDCGKESLMLVSEGTYALDGSLRSYAPCFHLTGHWTVKPAVQQVVLVREMFPHLHAAGFSALWRSAVAQENIKFGSYIQEHADSLAGELQRLGLETAHRPFVHS
jgi:hypothetical protein